MIARLWRALEVFLIMSLRGRFGAFVAERDPHALALALDAWSEACARPPEGRDPAAIDGLRAPLRESLRRRRGPRRWSPCS